MGDVLHTLPAVTDARRRLGEVSFDWIVEAAFSEIPAWHEGVNRTIPLSLRKWRRDPGAWFGGTVREAFGNIRGRRYDCIIDAQGLYKSALVACLARGVRAGYAADSAREPPAARLYSRRASVPRDLHAIERTRRLFAQVLDYEAPDSDPDFGLIKEDFDSDYASGRPYLVANHASSWPTKSWPEAYWRDLIERAADRGMDVLLPWGGEEERRQALRIARGSSTAVVLPAMTLGGLAGVLARAAAVVSVDTGLGHLAAALGTPAVSIYGATDPSRTGAIGHNQHWLRASFECSPCFSRTCTFSGPSEVAPACYSTVSTEQVWGTLLRCIKREDT